MLYHIWVRLKLQFTWEQHSSATVSLRIKQAGCAKILWPCHPYFMGEKTFGWRAILQSKSAIDLTMLWNNPLINLTLSIDKQTSPYLNSSVMSSKLDIRYQIAFLHSYLTCFRSQEDMWEIRLVFFSTKAVHKSDVSHHTDLSVMFICLCS